MIIPYASYGGLGSEFLFLYLKSVNKRVRSGRECYSPFQKENSSFVATQLGELWKYMNQT